MVRGLVVSCFFMSTQVLAQDQAEWRATARRLAQDAMDLADRGDCTAALPLLAKAEALYHAPVHLQYVARCHAQKGHLVAATETWRALSREKLLPDAPAIFRDAVAEAFREIERLEPKLGTLTLRTTRSYAGAAIELDGQALPPAAVDAPFVVDPGHHELVVEAPGYEAWRREFDVAEGGKTTIDWTLREMTAQPSDAGGPLVMPEAPGPTDSVRPRAAKTVGIALCSAGGAALLAGAITWGVRNADRSRLRQQCPGGDCEFDPQSDKSRIQTMTAVTNVLAFGGASLAASGALVWWLSAKREAPKVAVGAGLTKAEGFITLRGTFR
jgi:hypothetical protein